MQGLPKDYGAYSMIKDVIIRLYRISKYDGLRLYDDYRDYTIITDYMRFLSSKWLQKI